MPATPLHDALAAAGARFGEFGGAETAASFGAVAKEYAALRTGAGVYDLGRRAKIAVKGNDRTRWLNGMVTNNIRDLAPDHGNYNFLLNAQGHILADMYIYNRGGYFVGEPESPYAGGESFDTDYFVVDTDVSQAAAVLQLFNKYIIMDDVEVADRSEQNTAIGLAGPKAQEILAKVSLAAPGPPLVIVDIDWQAIGGASILQKDTPDRDEFELWFANPPFIQPSNAEKLWSSLVAAGATPVGYEALELARVAAGIPRFGVDIREKDLPQETAQQRALNFNKGCYLGQEIVERIHARGAVHRTLAGFELEGAAAPGAKVSSGGKEVGQVTSVAQLPNGTHRTLALGYVRRESSLPGTEVEIEGAKARVSALPFPESERSHG